MAHEICEIHHALQTGGIIVGHTDAWYRAVVCGRGGDRVIAETPHRRNHLSWDEAAKQDLDDLVRRLLSRGWQPLAGTLAGLPRFERP